jgi:hypothetical protein
MSGASETLAGTLAGVSTASAIGGPSGLPALSPAEKLPRPYRGLRPAHYAGSATAMQHPSGKGPGARFAACF